MRDRGAYAVPGDMITPYERPVDRAALEGCTKDDDGVYRKPGTAGTWDGSDDDARRPAPRQARRRVTGGRGRR